MNNTDMCITVLSKHFAGYFAFDLGIASAIET